LTTPGLDRDHLISLILRRIYLESLAIREESSNGELLEEDLRVASQEILHDLLVFHSFTLSAHLYRLQEEVVAHMLTQIAQHFQHLKTHILSRISAVTSLVPWEDRPSLTFPRVLANLATDLRLSRTPLEGFI
jgi:hypothetical protein